MFLPSRNPSADIPRNDDRPFSNILSGFRRRSSISNTTTTTSSSRFSVVHINPKFIAHPGNSMTSSSSHSIGSLISNAHIVDGEDAGSQKQLAVASHTTNHDNVDPAMIMSDLPSGHHTTSDTTHFHTSSIMSATSSVVVSSPSVNVDAENTNSAFLTNGDLYSNLATFSFGSPRTSSSTSDSYDADAETSGEFISPLTPMDRKLSIDRTPRPSVSAHSPGKATGSHIPQQHRQTSNQSASTSTSRTRTRVAASNYYTNDDENDEPADFGYHPRRGRKSSDSASQHTFGGGDRRSGIRTSSSSRSGSRSSVRSAPLEFSSEDEVELDYDFAHGTYTQGGLHVEEELGAGGDYMDPISQGRRRSLPLAIPGVSPDALIDDEGLRNREDSLATLRRPSRSLDDDLTMMNAIAAVAKVKETVVPKSEPSTRADWRNLEAQQQQQRQDMQPAPSQNALDGYDPSYILDEGSRRGSFAPSWMDQSAAVSRNQPSRQSTGFKVGGWGAGLAWSAGRRASTATTGQNDDSFTANVRRFDPEFGGQRGEWCFKREMADGFGALRQNSRSSIKSGHGRDPLAAINDGEREKRRRATMVPGNQELWKNEFVGRFKVDRLALRSRSQGPSKPPQQRLNIRHIIDPYSSGNQRGGPSSVVHKHSKAIAFSLFRHYGLLTRSAVMGAPGSPVQPTSQPHRPLPGTSGAIMLAPKKVQEQYTSTRTTSKLATHGFLGDEDKPDRSGMAARHGGRRRAASVIGQREHEKKEKEKKQREKEEKSKAKKAQQKKKELTESEESSSTMNSAHEPIFRPKEDGRERRHSTHQVRHVLVSTTTTSSHAPSTSTAGTSSSNTIKKHSSFESSLAAGSSGPSTNASELFRNSSEYPSDDTLLDRGSIDGVDDRPVTRTPHAEAFASLDPNTIEYVRSKNGSRAPLDGTVHWSKRWLPAFGRPTKSITNTPAFPASPSVAVLDAKYNPPWMTIAGRTAQETNERLIQNLNDSFKDVGLVHTKPAKTSNKRKNKTGRNLFGEVPDDALYMLLPLWASETDEASQARSPRVKFENVPVNERLYLLVYYVPFDEKEKPRQRTKKTKSQSSGSNSIDSTDSKIVFLSAFRVSARLVGYDELRGTGVRLPNTGLSVTGPVREALQYAPPSSICDEHYDDSVVATCMERECGIQFYPEGLFKLGLSLPVSDSENDAVHHLELDQMKLSPIGRSAVEMIWLGCMALTSFGPT